jgi:hypothetical protein
MSTDMQAWLAVSSHLVNHSHLQRQPDPNQTPSALQKLIWWDKDPSDIDRERIAQAVTTMFDELTEPVDEKTKKTTLAKLTLDVL